MLPLFGRRFGAEFSFFMLFHFMLQTTKLFSFFFLACAARYTIARISMIDFHVSAAAADGAIVERECNGCGFWLPNNGAASAPPQPSSLLNVRSLVRSLLSQSLTALCPIFCRTINDKTFSSKQHTKRQRKKTNLKIGFRAVAARNIFEIEDIIF